MVTSIEVRRWKILIYTLFTLSSLTLLLLSQCCLKSVDEFLAEPRPLKKDSSSFPKRKRCVRTLNLYKSCICKHILILKKDSSSLPKSILHPGILMQSQWLSSVFLNHFIILFLSSNNVLFFFYLIYPNTYCVSVATLPSYAYEKLPAIISCSTIDHYKKVHSSIGSSCF